MDNIGKVTMIFCGLLIIATVWVIVTAFIRKTVKFMDSSATSSDELTKIREMIESMQARIEQLEKSQKN